MEHCVNDSTLSEKLMLDKEYADGKCGDDLYWKLVNNTLHIFGTGELCPWAWKRCFPIPFSRVCIGSGCTKISKSAFSPVFARETDRTIPDEFRLETVYIPSTVREIGENAFRCSGLESLVVPDSVTQIGRNAFRGVWCICYHGPARSEDWWGTVRFNGEARPAWESPWDSECMDGLLDEPLVTQDIEGLDIPEYDY